ncbi:MAG: flagellar basal body protein [Candidatus Margulisbacteria bacterium]|nr:flagellar basal body protein [Candidatus Margulisiibacteriota bacterium]
MATAVERQAVIAQNIANANTPGYEPLEFDEVLQKAVKRRDQENVSIEKEMALLADNSVKYSSYAKLMSSKVNLMKTIISQGRK